MAGPTGATGDGGNGDGTVWSGQWVADRLGVGLDGGPELRDLLGLALRRNPRRAHLLVSNVLGKHVPRHPRTVYGTGLALGRRVRELLGDEAAARAVVLGYAETATGLGHSVADGLALAPYLHSTRRPVAGVRPVGGFEEEHSHATSHLLLPEDPELLAGSGPLVLVDDEFSTGRTVLNTIAALHARYPRDRYVVVALVDMRSAADRDRLDAFAADLGARVDLVALASGTVSLPDGVLERGQELVAAHEVPVDPAGSETSGAAESGDGAGRLTRVDPGWPVGLPDGGRHGFTPAHREKLEAELPRMAARIAEALPAAPAAQAAADSSPAGARRVLVLGFEELMYAPLRLAEALADVLPDGVDVRYSTTTRSPVLAVDDPGYAIRTRLTFPAHDAPADGPGERYAYNVAPGADPARRFDAVVAVVDSTADTPELHAAGGLLDRLAPHTDQVLLAVVPSYTPHIPEVPTVPERQAQ
ncbi:phosphoribosyltransferase family protein [Streptomyces sp. SAJ15]|uniref:phosphoribosyltransferase family protein n=1 Tax=Streptomyces sp. SAJ15 TaxID=2011095 RepID=UPI0037D9D5D6